MYLMYRAPGSHPFKSQRERHALGCALKVVSVYTIIIMNPIQFLLEMLFFQLPLDLARSEETVAAWEVAEGAGRKGDGGHGGYRAPSCDT